MTENQDPNTAAEDQNSFPADASPETHAMTEGQQVANSHEDAISLGSDDAGALPESPRNAEANADVPAVVAEESVVTVEVPTVAAEEQTAVDEVQAVVAEEQGITVEEQGIAVEEQTVDVEEQVEVPTVAAEEQTVFAEESMVAGEEQTVVAEEVQEVAAEEAQEFSFALDSPGGQTGTADRQEPDRDAVSQDSNILTSGVVRIIPTSEPPPLRDPNEPASRDLSGIPSRDLGGPPTREVGGAPMRDLSSGGGGADSGRGGAQPESQDPNKRIVFGIKRKSETAVLDEPKVVDEHFPYNQTILWQPVTHGAKAGNGKTDGSQPVAVVVTQEVLLRVNQHVAQTLEHEVGGFLIGDHCRCPETNREFIMIDQFSPAKFTEATEVSLAFTVDAWAHMNSELGGKFRGKLCVGWYHSHPKMDVFLSRYDMEIQNERFAQTWMTALVLEPEKHRGGFFCWRGGNVNPNEAVEFYELLERNSRESVLAWTNYVGIDTVTHQKPQLKKINTLTAGTREEATPQQQQRPFPSSAVMPGGAATMSSIVLPPQKRGTNKAVFWAVIAAALLLGLASVWAIVKMRVGAEEKVSSDTSAANNNAAAATTAAATTSSVPEDGETILPVSIVSIEGYQLVPDKDSVLGVHMIVENVPDQLNVELAGRVATIVRNKKLSGAGNKRDLFATVNFAPEIEKMARRPDTPLDILVKVIDPDDAENYETQQLTIDPDQLGLDHKDRHAPRQEVKVDKSKVKVLDRKSGPIRNKRPRANPSTRAAANKTQAHNAQGTQPKEPEPQPSSETKKPDPPKQPEKKQPCNFVMRALKKC